MASWLKVAEDLLEVVDRRAKLVVSELGDEKSEPQAAEASKSEQIHTKKIKKGQLLSSKGNKKIEKTKELSVSNPKTEKANSSSVEIQHSDASNTAETGSNMPSKSSRDTASLDVENEKNDNDISNNEGIQLVKDNEANSMSSMNEDIKGTDLNEQSDLSSFLPLAEKEVDTTGASHSSDGERKPTPNGTSLPVDEDKTQSLIVEGHINSNKEENKSETLSENFPSTIKLQEHKTDSLMKVEDQLDEAQGLLKTAVKTGQSKEARLARVCNGLSTRLQEYKAENKQLEELLVEERELNSSYEARIKQFQQELSVCKMEAARAESNMSEALAAKNSEIEALVCSLESLKKHAASSDEKLASLESDMEAIRRGRELTETHVIQALREELASTEHRAEEERAAHNATKMAAVEREVELEHRAVEASNALARIQRTADESAARAAELEHKVALLEVECASLNQELQDLEARSRRGQKKPSEEANQLLQVQVWQEEVDRSRQGQRDAENKLSAVNAELQKMRVEMAGMKRDAEHYSRQEHIELEKRYRELTDLLYHKQTQLEAVASEKAALEFQLEKELKRLQELEAERSRNARRASPSWEENADMKMLEPLPLHHRHMVGASRQVKLSLFSRFCLHVVPLISHMTDLQLQRAAKLLDSGAVRATRFLWRYPTARVILLFYLVFVHLFLMYLLHRLQEQADNFASKEVAASLGLNTSSLP